MEDRLFATLDPKSSRLRFPRDTEAVITDTVGFIRNLPKELFAAFRATLEELREADVLLHLIDVSSADFENHITAVEKILEELGIASKPTIRVFNKEDRVADKGLLPTLCRRFDAIALSALHPGSFKPLLEKLEWLIRKRITSACHGMTETALGIRDHRSGRLSKLSPLGKILDASTAADRLLGSISIAIGARCSLREHWPHDSMEQNLRDLVILCLLAAATAAVY